MSDANVVIGYIHEAPSALRPDDGDLFRRANDDAIASLPESDAWPSLCRPMFSITGDNSEHGSFRGGRLIHFAGHINYLVADFEQWMPKFENLLRQLYWTRARIFALDAFSALPVHVSLEVSSTAILVYRGDAPKPPMQWKTTRTELTV